MTKERVSEVLGAVNDYSRSVSGLWITFLSVGTYLAVAIGTSTHDQLLLGAPVKLPLLGVDMPLFTFYQFGPALFVMLHMYLMLQIRLLGVRLSLLLREIDQSWISRADLAVLFAKLDGFVVTQAFAETTESPVVRRASRATLWLTLIVGPLAILVIFQLRFLPYHDEFTTWTHRATLMLDLVLVGAFISTIPHHARRGYSSRALIVSRTVLLIVAASITIFSFLVATIPGETIDRTVVRSGWPILTGPDGAKVWWPTWYVFERRRLGILTETPLFTRDLIILNSMVIDARGSSQARQDRPLSLRGRDLRYASMDGINLSHADLTGAQLDGASLRGANLEYTSLGFANLADADLTQANLRGADLSSVRMEGAVLREAILRGARIGGVLDGVDLSGAELQGASIDAQLVGANLSSAKLQGATLSNVIMYAADLSRVQLQGAWLDLPDMEAVDLSLANLGGADFFAPHLEGSSLDFADFQGASIGHAYVWRASLDANHRPAASLKPDSKPLSVSELKEIAMLVASIPEHNLHLREAALKRVQVLIEPLAQEEEQKRLASLQPLTSVNELSDEGDRSRAALHAALGCSRDGAPYVARQFVSHLRNVYLRERPYAVYLARAFQDQNCVGVRGLTDAEKDMIDEFAARPLPPSPSRQSTSTSPAGKVTPHR